MPAELPVVAPSLCRSERAGANCLFMALQVGEMDSQVQLAPLVERSHNAPDSEAFLTFLGAANELLAGKRCDDKPGRVG